MFSFKRKVSRWLAIILGFALSFNLISIHVSAEDINSSVTGISISTSKLTLKQIGDIYQLGAAVQSNDSSTDSLLWESDNPKVVTVDNSGMVTAVSAGTAAITVFTGDKSYNDICKVTVPEQIKLEDSSEEIKVSGIILNESSISLNADNKSYQLVADVSPEDATDKSVVWESSNTDIATVNQNGFVGGIATGYAIITATTVDGGYQSQCSVNVHLPALVESITFDKEQLHMSTKGERQFLKATIYPDTAENKKLEWNSSDPQIVKVDDTGNIQSVGTGTANIIAKAKDGSNVEGICKVTVEGAPVEEFSITTEPFTLTAKGSTQLLSTTFTPENAFNQNIVWTSSDPKVATVDKKGKVTAISNGLFQITGTTEEGNFTDKISGNVDIKGHNEDDDNYDNTAPVIKNIRAVNSEIATPDVVSLEFDIEETGSGLNYLSVHLEAKDYAGDHSNNDIEFGFRNFSSGSFSGTYRLDIPINEYAPVGTWEITHISLTDMRNNATYGQEVSSLPTINVVSSKRTDTISPQINSVKVLTSEVQAPGTVTFEIDLKEEGSGVSKMGLDVRYMDESVFAYDNQDISFEPDSTKTGVYKVRYHITDEFAYPGMWGFYSISLVDKQGNFSVAYLGDTSVFNLTSDRTDVTAPILKSIHISPEELTAPGILNLELEIEEEGSGLESISFDLYNETHSTLGLMFQRIDVNQNNGKSGIYKTSIPINAYISEGTYYVKNLTIKDKQGNDSGYTWGKDQNEESVNGEGQVSIYNELKISLQTTLTNPELIEMIGKTPDNGVILLYPDTDIISADVFRAIAGTNRTIVINGDGIQWVFNGMDIDPDKVKDIDTSTSLNIKDGKEYGFDENIMEIVFPNNGELPGRVKIRLKSDYLFNLYNVNGSLNLSWLNQDGAILEDNNVICGADTYTEFYLTHNSTFLLSTKEAFSDLKGINVQPPQKTEYELGSTELNLTGLTVKAIYASGAEQKIEDFQLSGFDGDKLGQQTIKVSYRDYDASFDITVIPKNQEQDKTGIIPLNDTKSRITNTKSPKTGDNTEQAGLILSLLSSIMILVSLKKRSS